MKRKFEESDQQYEDRYTKRISIFNWSRLAAAGTALVAFGTIAIWLTSKVFSAQLGNLPELVSQHTTEISNIQGQINTLQMSDITNDIIINNNFERMYQQERWIERRLNNNSTNGIP